MANPEHLAKLKEGVEAWNAWRKENPETAPSLRGASLAETRLANIDLSRSDLVKADLFGADLRGADLRRSVLTRSDLRFANLSNATLTSASLKAANLHGSTLQGADISHAVLFDTVVADLDLSKTRGLRTCNHLGPSIIDHRTFMRSVRLPLEFLRGCGVYDNFIEYLPSIVDSRPIELYSCFISHSSTDQEFADRLHADLQNRGVRCWLASEHLKIGARFREEIDAKIKIHDKLLVALSEASVESDWVEEEVETALERERKDPDRKTVLFPIRIDDAVMDTDRAWATSLKRRRQIGDFTSWKDHDSYKKAFDRLLRDLRVEGDGGG